MMQSISKMLLASAGLVLYQVELGWEDPRISKQAETILGVGGQRLDK